MATASLGVPSAVEGRRQKQLVLQEAVSMEMKLEVAWRHQPLFVLRLRRLFFVQPQPLLPLEVSPCLSGARALGHAVVLA